MENQDLNFITFSTIVEKLRPHKLMLLISVSLSLVLVLIYNYSATPIYRASATVSFERFSKDDMLDFDFTNSKYQLNYINNRKEEITTRNFVQEVLVKLPRYMGLRLLQGRDASLIDKARRRLMGSGNLEELKISKLPGSGNPSPSNFEGIGSAIKRITKDITVIHREARPNVLTIFFDSDEPETAAKFTNTVVSVLQKNNLEFRRKEFANLKGFIDGQIAIVQEKLQNSEDALREFKSMSKITSVDDESREIHRRITQAENLANKIKNEKLAKQQRLTLLNEKLALKEKDLTKSVTEASKTLLVKLREKLVDLELQLAGLRVQNYLENHPKIVELKSEIDLVKKNVLEMTMKIFEDRDQSGLIDPLKYLEESIALEMEIEPLRAQQDHLKKTLRSYNARLRNLSDKDATLFTLLRDREVNNKNYIRLLEEREQARLREAAEISNIHVIEHAEKPQTPYKPRKGLNIFIALFAGTAFGFLLVFAKEFLKGPSWNQEEVEERLQLPVLASIPRIKGKGASSSNQYNIIDNGACELLYRDAYSCLWNYMRELDVSKTQSVMIASAFPGEGKSTTAVNLAITAAKQGKKTLLIDGDIRKPSLHEALALSPSEGLSDLVSQMTEIHNKQANLFSNAVLQKAASTMLQVTSVERLQVLPAGNHRPTSDPQILWTSPVLKEIIDFFRESVDFVVIDAPPLLGIPDAVNIAAYVDGILLCVDWEKPNMKMLLRAQRLLHRFDKLLGVVLNKVEPLSIYGEYRYHEYYSSQTEKKSK